MIPCVRRKQQPRRALYEPENILTLETGKHLYYNHLFSSFTGSGISHKQYYTSKYYKRQKERKEHKLRFISLHLSMYKYGLDKYSRKMVKDLCLAYIGTVFVLYECGQLVPISCYLRHVGWR